MATSKPNRSTSRTIGASAERTWRRQLSTAPGWRRSPRKKRRLRRMAPSLRLPAARVSPFSPTRISVLPPPMSISTRRWSNTGTAWSTPRWMRRASSTPEMTSTSTPASSRARSRNSWAFSASRTALVATAWMSASWTAAMRARRSRATTPRSMASGVRRFMSPEPDPRRTISFSRAMTSKAGPAGPSTPSTSSTRATTMWNEFVPMSMAASGRSLTPSLLPQSGLSLHPAGGGDHGVAVAPARVAGGALDRARDADRRDARGPRRRAPAPTPTPRRPRARPTLATQPRSPATAAVPSSSASSRPAEPMPRGRLAPRGTMVRRPWGDWSAATQTRWSPSRT